MPNKSNKLPYVFVEIDAPEEVAIDVDHEDDSGFGPYSPMGHLPYMAPFPPERSHPSHYAAPSIANPMQYAYPQASQGYGNIDPRTVSPFFAGPPARRPFAPDDDDLLDDFIDEDPYDIEYDDEGHGLPYESPLSYEDMDDGSDESTLNLETVVIPVFKSAGTGSSASPQKGGAQGFQPVPFSPMMPFFSGLPFAYNPYRAPFVNPMWAIQRGPAIAGMQNAMRIPTQSFPPPMATQPATRTHGPSGQGQSRRSGMVEKRALSSNVSRNPSQKEPSLDDGGVQMPAEAREVFSSLKAPSPSNSGDRLQDRAPIASRIHEPITVEPINPVSEGQTITANTDAVSVSVKVIPPRNTGDRQNGVLPATGTDSGPGPVPISKPSAFSISEVGDRPSKPKKENGEGKHQKETFQEKAMRENAEKTHTSLDESGTENQVGRPLLDKNAIETSDMFSTPAASMNESMTGRQFRSSRRKHVFVIILLALILALVVAAIVCVFAIWTGAASITYGESNIPYITLSGFSGL